jgi:hypothetical protein
MAVAKARARVVARVRAARGVRPSTDVPFPFHKNYRQAEIDERVAAAGLDIVARHYSHYFVRLPANFPGSDALMAVDHRIAKRSNEMPRLASQFAESAVISLRAC